MSRKKIKSKLGYHTESYKYSVFKKEGVKVKGYYTAKKWILGAV